MDEVTKKWGNLSLTEREVIEHDLQDTARVEGAAIVAKFFTKRRVNLGAVANTLKSAWRTDLSFEVRDLGENKAVVLFEDETDMIRVLTNGPWSFDKYLLAVHKLGEEEQIQNISFDMVSFWVQLHDIPARRMTKETGERIGKTLGEIEEVDIPETANLLGKYIRVRVKVDTTQPLCRGRLVKFGGPTPVWVSCKYERLPIFCYWCGKLNHDEKECGIWLRSRGTVQAHDQQYGAWLRAKLENLQRPQRVQVNNSSNREKGKASNSGTMPMEISTTKERGRNRNEKEVAGRMEVEIMAEMDEAKRRQHETNNIPQNLGTSMSVGMGDIIDKTLAGSDEKLGRNVNNVVDILGPLTKTEDTKRAGVVFEVKGGKNDVVAPVCCDPKGTGLNPGEEIKMGSTMGLDTYAKAEKEGLNTSPLKAANANKPAQGKNQEPENNSTQKAPRQNRKHIQAGVSCDDGLEGKENDGFSSKSTKGTWKRINREAKTTVAVEGGSMEEGPKRKLLPTHGEEDPNMLQDKRAKLDTEVVLGKVFKKLLGSAEVARQPRRGQ